MRNLTLVLDIGQFSSKVGFAGKKSPSQVFFTIVGELKYQQIDFDYGKSKDACYALVFIFLYFHAKRRYTYVSILTFF